MSRRNVQKTSRAGAKLSVENSRFRATPSRQGSKLRGAVSINDREILMTLTIAHLSPIAALIAGILILIAPRLLNLVVAIYLILVGLTGLNAIYHFLG
jgi:Protein of unknown function (DUF3096)